MIIKNATQVGNPLIRSRAKEVADVKSKRVQKVIKDLIDSMRHIGLVGMAAPQIGSSLRIFVSEVRKTKYRKDEKKLERLRVYVNPRITWYSKKQISDSEGCGSVAASGLFAQVKRPASVAVKALDEHGKSFELKAHKLLARIIQHEMDHLNGVVFTDRADLKTYMSANEYMKGVRKNIRESKK